MERTKQQSLIAVAILAAVYAAMVMEPASKRMWHDELFTYYIAQAPDIPRLFDSILHVDLNPPMMYFAVRLCHSLFGVSEVSTRLPSVLGFFAGSLFALFFLKRRVGIYWSITAILFFWSTSYFRYATEARPYGLLLAFFCLTLFFYDKAGDGASKWPVAGIALGSAGMMLSHNLAPFSLLPFWAAELVRTIRTRRANWAVWLGLVAPLLIAVAYTPSVRSFQMAYFPADFQASFEKLGILYFALLVPPALIITALPTLIASTVGWKESSSDEPRKPWSPHEIAFAITLGLVPIAVTLALMKSKGAFWPRYCLTSALGMDMVLVVCLARSFRFRSQLALVGSLALLAAILVQRVRLPAPPAGSARMEDMGRDLPFVAASGLTFLEMDHYEPPSFVSRVFYLVDRDAAIQYAHATLFDGMPILKQYFPIRANVEAYRTFVAQHRHFLVFGDMSYPEDWLLAKLKADGAELVLRDKIPGPYKDVELYDVRLR